MKLGTALIAAVLLTASPLLAQAPPGAAQQKPAPAQPGQPAATPPAPSEKLDPAKDAAIRHLLEITGVSKEGEDIAAGWTDRVHTGMSRVVPADQLPKFMETFTAKFSASAPPAAITDAMVAIYARHFSIEDIQGVTKFYESPLGQLMVKEMPDVSREAQTAGMQMDQKVVIEVLRGMTDEYPQIKPMLPPDPSKPAPAPSAAPAPAPGSSATPPAAPAPSPAPTPKPPQQ
jgi:hypothetical protein